jgi:hypothetical protein
MNIPNHPNTYGQICTRLCTLDIDAGSGRIDDDDLEMISYATKRLQE